MANRTRDTYTGNSSSNEGRRAPGSTGDTAYTEAKKQPGYVPRGANPIQVAHPEYRGTVYTRDLTTGDLLDAAGNIVEYADGTTPEGAVGTLGGVPYTSLGLGAAGGAAAGFLVAAAPGAAIGAAVGAALGYLFGK